jgi:murein DD-endopeptidase MepM/ murein hydrolase activator NlpD
MPVNKLVYPHPLGTASHPPPRSDLHQTAGLPGNWALDFMAPGGTRFLAPETGTITRLSGHNPSEGVIDGDIYGWNIYLTAPSGIWYFATHLGNRDVKVGQKVTAGTILGHVGMWPHDPGRSHTHLGVTHPAGEQAAKDHICKVAAAARTRGHWPKA